MPSTNSADCNLDPPLVVHNAWHESHSAKLDGRYGHGSVHPCLQALTNTAGSGGNSTGTSCLPAISRNLQAKTWMTPVFGLAETNRGDPAQDP